MNERIKELAADARGQMVVLTTVDDEEQWRQHEEFVEKFAELIVRECLEACSRANEIRHFVPPTQQQVVLSCMDEIERTFRS
jgi:hypothetical protein